MSPAPTTHWGARRGWRTPRAWSIVERGEIHLLYLDSFDYDVDREQSEQHCLAEAEAALPALAPACLVLFDDTWPIGAAGSDGVPPLTGKGARAVPFLVGQGFRIEYTGGQQVLLSRGAGPLVDERGCPADPHRPEERRTSIVSG